MLYSLSVWQVVGMQGWTIGRSGRCTLWWNWSVGVGRGAGSSGLIDLSASASTAAPASRKKAPNPNFGSRLARMHDLSRPRRRRLGAGRGRSNSAVCNQHACAPRCSGFNRAVSHARATSFYQPLFCFECGLDYTTYMTVVIDREGSYSEPFKI